MTAISKPLLRLALAIHGQLALRNEWMVELPQGAWQRCADLVRQHRRAKIRDWHLAAEVLVRDLRYSVCTVESELAAIRDRLPRSLIPNDCVKPAELYRDLIALREEFAALDYDLRERWLSVTTAPIELHGVYLGPFEVRLEWSRALGELSSYRVIAKDPHPAANRENVTHPHVQDEILCEGDGRHAIRQALFQGRLLDFFTLVAVVLRTYNAESPFVELALWHGSSCSDCGYAMDEEARYLCQRCEADVCGDCESACCGCGNSCCSHCIGACAACDDNYCALCLKPCRGCRSRVCSGCLDNDERCLNCHEEECSEDSAPAATAAAVQPHGLGQASLPAGRG